ncbi:FAD-dependent oxidoreductase [Actinoallomurus rhizosphaericola]|uniref:FAD-dependent oxidoreductase n=1 Tax=Actinoallomurus rhizosphaericola TaxID=2952536 RepID=UPI0020915F02|nr:FAD-dependent oxidoreductase [Actinoallomurus rhizosphaericola]MCO5994179.1 FAD-dependent oxidoreductase [Actinoallomurus rhizosphaericola]
MSRDRRRVRHPPPPGRPHADALAERPRAVVVGGGIAGLTAATALAERGVAVELYEREDHLGGRAGGWTATLPGGDRVGMSRGFHAFFRQYYNLRALLRRTDPDLDRLRALPDYPLIDAAGRTDTFRGLPAVPPWNALAFALRSPTFTARDLLRLNARAALPLMNVTVPGTYRRLDHLDAAEFLTRLRFPAAARHLAFDVFSRSFFAPPDRLSAAELAVMFHLYFLGSAEGLLFDVPRRPLGDLWAAAGRHLADLGADVRTGTAVDAVRPRPGGFTVQTSYGGRPADAVVLALDVPGLRDLVAASPGLGDPEWRRRVAAQETAPPYLVRRLWLDRPVAADRPAFLATGGLPPLDNVSVLNRYDEEAASWARSTGGSVVELHAYAVTGARGPASARLLRRLHEVYPETGEASIVGDLTEWRRDCPLFAPGTFTRRPTVDGPVAGLVLAGDGVRVDLPVALMERAATTGWHAANRLLTRWGLAGHPLTTVPLRGRLAVLRRLADLAPAH